MKNIYKTITELSEGYYKEKGSKFISFAYPVTTEEEIKNCIEELKKKYYDARHFCYAYVLGEDYRHYRVNDDGEPNHSAGDPILGQIRSRELTNILIVVVRYFGGTKLGVGGLINAYKTAAEGALSNNNVVVVPISTTYTIVFGYEDTNEVMRFVKEFDLEIFEQQFEANCFLKVGVKLEMEERFNNRVKLLKDLGHALVVKKK